IARQWKDNLMAQAVALYQEEKAKTFRGKPASLHAVCKAISDDYFLRTQIQIHLDHNTLSRLSNGGRSLMETNAKKCWLTGKEQEVIVQFVIELAQCGFPLSPKQLWEHTEHILRACLGDRFLEDGLGKNWATQFITRH
ncbi:hypothetical protein EI94DRAFT_1521643, partial [Lactarius quietus]